MGGPWSIALTVPVQYFSNGLHKNSMSSHPVGGREGGREGGKRGREGVWERRREKGREGGIEK